MKAKLFPAALNSLFVVTGCETVTCVEPGMKTNVPEKPYQQFTGEWQWYKTYNGWSSLETPASKGYSETIFFGAGNRYKNLRNGSVVEEYLYYISKEKSYNSGRDSVFVFYEQKSQKSSLGKPLYLIGKDTLHTRMSEGCNDCPEEYYVRKKVTGTN